MTTTITLEFNAEPRLSELEHELKLIHGLHVFLAEPRDPSAPVLLSVAIDVHGSEQGHLAVRRIAHTIYDFLHGSQRETQPPVMLVTIEGESMDIAPLSYDEIERVIATAYGGQFPENM